MPRSRTRTKEKRSEEVNRPGTRKQTSTSKTIKKIANKKNFMQKGTCERPAGSKPHSKGERVSEEESEEGEKPEMKRTVNVEIIL